MNARYKILLSCLIFFTVSGATLAQDDGFPTPAPMGSAASPFDPTIYGTVMVYLRTEDGQLLPRNITPIISIGPATGGQSLRLVPQLTGEGWLYSGVPIGNEYQVQVVATGYTLAAERVHMPNTAGASASVVVFMHRADQELVFHPPTGSFVLPPKAQKEIQHSLEDLQRGQAQSSLKHTQKAMQLAPDNPYVEYVMGLTYVLTQHFKEAKPYLEKSVTMDSKQPNALNALGTVCFRLGDNAGAIQALSKAVQLDGTMWKAEWTLAVADLAEKKYADARDHAEQAMKVGKDKAGQVQLALGQALAGLGEREQAAKLFDKFAAEYPNDANAANAVKWAALMRQPIPVNVSKTMSGSLRNEMALAPTPTVEVPPRADWAPPDVDAIKPFVISGTTCPLEQVMKAAGENAEQFVSTLEMFSATEQFQAIEIKRDGELDKPNAQAFNYFAFVEHVTPTVFQLNEVREQNSQPAKLSARVSDLGAPGLALAFHRTIRDNLDWTCEGLGKWNDQPAWVVHFKQRPDRPSVLSMFATPSHSYSMPLKGRAWVSQQGGQILHLDTDLVKEIQPVDLKREHFSIDYKLVSFQKHNTDLWLPENVDTYIQYQGHFLHHYHHYSDFKLFWVGASQKISEPKEASQPQKQNEQPQQQQHH